MDRASRLNDVHVFLASGVTEADNPCGSNHYHYGVRYECSSSLYLASDWYMGSSTTKASQRVNEIAVENSGYETCGGDLVSFWLPVWRSASDSRYISDGDWRTLEGEDCMPLDFISIFGLHYWDTDEHTHTHTTATSRQHPNQLDLLK